MMMTWQIHVADVLVLSILLDPLMVSTGKMPMDHTKRRVLMVIEELTRSHEVHQCQSVVVSVLQHYRNADRHLRRIFIIIISEDKQPVRLPKSDTMIQVGLKPNGFIWLQITTTDVCFTF